MKTRIARQVLPATAFFLAAAAMLPAAGTEPGRGQYEVGEWVPFGPSVFTQQAIETGAGYVGSIQRFLQFHSPTSFDFNLMPDTVALEVRFHEPAVFGVARSLNQSPHYTEVYTVEVVEEVPAGHSASSQTTSAGYLVVGPADGARPLFVTRDGTAENLTSRYTLSNPTSTPVTLLGWDLVMEVRGADFSLTGPFGETVEPGESIAMEISVAVDPDLAEEVHSWLTYTAYVLRTDAPFRPTDYRAAGFRVFDTAADVPPEYFPAAQPTSVEQWVLY